MRMRYMLILMCVAVIMIAGGPMNADTQYILPGTDARDTRSYPRLLMLQAVDEEAALQLSGDLLRATPKNHAVLWFRSELLLRMGKLDEAAKAVKLLRKMKPRWAMGSMVEIDLLVAMGENKKAANALESFLREEFSDPLEVLSAKVNSIFAPARIAELRGKTKEAEVVWKTLIKDKKASAAGRSARMAELGRFYLRHGQDVKAERMFREALKIRGEDIPDDARVDALLPLVETLWVQGNLDQAVASAKDLVKICERLSLDSDVCLHALLTSYMLFQHSNDKMAASQAELLLQKAARMDTLTKRITGFAPLVRGRWKSRDVKSVADRTRMILKSAPRLEWARWTALYLALQNPADYEGLQKTLPDDSLQRRIYRQVMSKAKPQRDSTPE